MRNIQEVYIKKELAKKIELKAQSDVDCKVSQEVGGKRQDPIFEKLEKEFAEVINRNSIENWSNTPDFILAKYLVDCLKAFSDTSNDREKWYRIFNKQVRSKLIAKL